MVGGGGLPGEDVKANRKCTPGRWVYMTPVGVQMVIPVSRQQWLRGFPTGVVGCGSTREWRSIEPVSCPIQRIKWQLALRKELSWNKSNPWPFPWVLYPIFILENGIKTYYCRDGLAVKNTLNLQRTWVWLPVHIWRLTLFWSYVCRPNTNTRKRIK